MTKADCQCDSCKTALQCEKSLVDVLKRISKIINNVKYECSSRMYTLDEEEMSWVFYCRDLADEAIRNYHEN